MKILISYRRADEAIAATMLHEKLAEIFGGEKVFMDVDAIPAGRDFRQYLEGEVAKADVVLVVIGAKWLNLCDSEGRRRIDQPTDWVHIEIAAALKREIPVIPLLVGDAKMPTEAELPEPLCGLAYRQALPLRSGRDFHKDVGVLRHEIERTCGVTAVQPVEHPRLGRQTLVGQPIMMSRSRSPLVTATPELGEHTDQVLAELGYDASEIGALRADGIV